MYKPYADETYYFETYQGTVLKSDECQRYLKQASRHIDSLTYNRIVGQGFSNLTAFQQDVIREVICEQADFEYENAEVIETVLSSYSIMGPQCSLRSHGMFTQIKAWLCEKIFMHSYPKRAYAAG